MDTSFNISMVDTIKKVVMTRLITVVGGEIATSMEMSMTNIRCGWICPGSMDP